MLCIESFRLHSSSTDLCTARTTAADANVHIITVNYGNSLLILLSSCGRWSSYRGDEPGYRKHRHHLRDQHGEADSYNPRSIISNQCADWAN